MSFQSSASDSSAPGRAAERRRSRYERALTFGIPLIYVLLGVICWNRIGPRDFDQFVVFHEIQYWNHALFGLAKQWSPLLCSGVSTAAEPQIPLFSLSMLLSYVGGPLRGLDTAITLYFLVGWVGAYLYAGLWTSDRRTRQLAAALFIGNGFFVCRLGYGHVDFIPFTTLPLILWTLHRCLPADAPAKAQDRSRSLRLAAATLLLGAGLGIIIDGSPVSLLHLLLWIILYTFVLCLVARAAAPALVLGSAILLASILDAGYLWPMIAAQTEFPRHTLDTFTNPLALPFFMLLPLQGKPITPAVGNGHEMSVYIGPVLAYAIWHFRAALWNELPPRLKFPLLVVSIVSVVLGSGSLRLLHVPDLFGLFDVLRPLPGFRSMWVTARYWGVLALPLSLLGASAFRRLLADDLTRTTSHATTVRTPIAADRNACWRRHGLPIAALLLQFGFQIGTLTSNWLPGRPYEAVDFRHTFSPEGAEINYVYCGREDQGLFIRPDQGVIDCYDNDDFTRAAMKPGSQLLRSVRYDATGRSVEVLPAMAVARFLGWNRIRVTPQASFAADGGGAASPISVTLNQAFNRHWTSADCTVGRGAGNDLSISCASTRWRQGPVELRFNDPISDRAVRISLRAWQFLLGLLAAAALCAALTLFTRRKGSSA